MLVSQSPASEPADPTKYKHTKVDGCQVALHAFTAN
jgi:hypothetical protein